MLTRLMYLLHGTPPSRAKDQRSRDAVAMIPIEAQPINVTIIAVIIDAPVSLCVAALKISMKGTPVLVPSAACASPRQKSSAIYL